MKQHPSSIQFRPPVSFRWLAPLVVAGALAFGSPTVAQDSTPGVATPTDATPAPGAPRIELTFEELNDSGVTGTAILSEVNDQTLVELEMEGVGENHPAHIHEGTCDDITAEPAHNLANVDDTGASTTLVDAPLQDLIDGDYVIDLHLAPDQLGTLIDCVEIEGTPEAPDGATPEATPDAVGGEGTEEAATEEATEEPAATEEATEVATEEATEEPAATEEATTEADSTETPDSVGGTNENDSDGTNGDSTTSGVTDPANEGKGVPVGGDGTDAKPASLGGNNSANHPGATGVGSSLLEPMQSHSVAIQAMSVFAAILLFAGFGIRRGETRSVRTNRSPRFRRLGL